MPPPRRRAAATGEAEVAGLEDRGELAGLVQLAAGQLLLAEQVAILHLEPGLAGGEAVHLATEREVFGFEVFNDFRIVFITKPEPRIDPCITKLFEINGSLWSCRWFRIKFIVHGLHLAWVVTNNRE